MIQALAFAERSSPNWEWRFALLAASCSNPASMNAATLLTLARLPLLLIISACLITASPGSGGATVALVLFIIAALTDWLDGWVARRFNQITDFGKWMDALLDKILVLGVLAGLLTIGGVLPPWTLILFVLMLSREFMVTGLRLMAAGRQVVLAAEKAGKIKTVLQMVSLISLLLALSLVSDFGMDPSESPAANFFLLAGLITLILATLQTVYSGALYFLRHRDLLTDLSPPSPSS